MKKFLSMLLILCLFLGALPAQALAYVADNIQRADTVEQVSVGNSSLVLQNNYIRMTLNKQDGSLTTSPPQRRAVSIKQTSKNHSVSLLHGKATAITNRSLCIPQRSA